MSEPISIKQQLAQLKGITLKTGGIHEAQALQLRNYPLVITGVKSCKVKVNTELKIVFYELEPEKKTIKKTEMFEKTCEAIVKWIRTIVWDDTSVVFKLKKEILYDSRSR